MKAKQQHFIWLLFAVVITTIGVFLFGLWGTILRLFKGEELPTIQQRRNKQREIDAIPVSFPLPRHAQSYVSIAHSLEVAMQGAGTNYRAIENALTGLTDNELRQVYKDFGIRKNTFWWSSYEGDLFTWFTQELSTWAEKHQLDKLKQKFSNTGIWQ